MPMDRACNHCVLASATTRLQYQQNVDGTLTNDGKVLIGLCSSIAMNDIFRLQCSHLTYYATNIPVLRQPIENASGLSPAKRCRLPGVTSAMCVDQNGLCLASKGSMSKYACGPIASLAKQASTLSNQSQGSPVIVIESQNGPALGNLISREIRELQLVAMNAAHLFAYMLLTVPGIWSRPMVASVQAGGGRPTALGTETWFNDVVIMDALVDSVIFDDDAVAFYNDNDIQGKSNRHR
ncbi:hypothetical protein BaRGS_00018221 [Batillaria attramentaria]|uniref:Late endosomal/lysosomal adaptor and MAPK and MTOR activator 5 n=1 Tax=Batillaria attramentaria TaxID=370345 RepID=A0ABD0KUA6_9CAEN